MNDKRLKIHEVIYNFTNEDYKCQSLTLWCSFSNFVIKSGKSNFCTQDFGSYDITKLIFSNCISVNLTDVIVTNWPLHQCFSHPLFFQLQRKSRFVVRQDIKKGEARWYGVCILSLCPRLFRQRQAVFML